MKGSLALSAFILLVGGVAAHGAATPPETVTVHEEQVDIPTYRMGPPEANPMFFFGKQSQGAEGRIYPYPLYDNLTGEKTERKYRVIYLENEYIKVGILPEIGGRVLSAVDKTNQYDFVYHQHVIKPALIGLIGAWMSGGIEWNIPHHHRATSFLPVQWRIQTNPDGSATVWVGELELRQQMRWAVGYTLHPGRSDLEAKVRIINRTPVAHSMLGFANLAVAADEAYQIIFPPSTRLVTYHSKREFATWPIAASRFNGVDFSRGVDVSWYRNHPEPNSMFAWDTEEDFFAGYDHARDAGTMSIADHTLAPGKKFFTWGNGTTGRLWGGILTDHDGPYLELMTGAYSDNQPDYSWMQPYETREYSQYWYPFRAIGGVKNANLQAAVNLEVKDGWITLGFCSTARHERAVVRLTQGSRTALTETITIDPGLPYAKRFKLPEGEGDLRAALLADRRELVAYTAPRAAETALSTSDAMPPTYAPPPLPAAVATNEQLYLDGLRIEQFHNPAFNPDDYWVEALRRDPDDARVNAALGREMLGRYRYADAERHFRAAAARLGANYTRSKDTEPLYYLGVALRSEGDEVAAARVLADAAWSQEWRGPADFALAELACRRGDFAAAADLAQRSLDANALNVRALTLRAAALRRLTRDDEAAQCLQRAALIDPLEVRIATEQWLLSKSDGLPDELRRNLKENPGAALEVAAELDAAGLWIEENRFLGQYVANAAGREGFSPVTWYFLADCQDRLARPDQARRSRRQGASAPIAGIFPFQPQAISLLRRAVAADPTDAKAPYYLGELLFDGQPDEAVALWEKSAALEPNNPLVLRNLAVAYSHRPGGENLVRAIGWLEKAVALPHPSAVHFFELDQLYERLGTAPEKRLVLLAANRETVSRRDDAMARLINLEIACGQPDDAIQILERRTFNIWEGYTAFDTATSWIDAHVARGRQRLDQGNYSGALADFETASQFPPNLQVDLGSPAVRRLAEIGYWQGAAEEQLGARAEAKVRWQQAADAALPPESSPQRHEQEEYRAKARQKLDRTDSGGGDRPLNAFLQPYLDRQVIAGAVSLAGNATGVRDAETVGFADIAAARPMREDTLFWIASMSKTLTAVGAMMLVDEGKLSVADPVEKFIPSFRGRSMLVRHLLSHTSGLPMASPAEKPTSDTLTLQAAADSYAKTPALFAPGAGYHYSNAGFNTVGRIIEVISGQPYDEFMAQRLFRPLGMKDTTLRPTAAQIARLAQIYLRDPKTGTLKMRPLGGFQLPLSDPTRQPMPAGGYFSTGRDIAIFCQMMLNGGVYHGRRYLSEQRIREMTAKQTGSSISTFYGFGWDSLGHGIWVHAGGYHTMMAIDPNRHFFAVLMVQYGGKFPKPEGDGILDGFVEAAAAAVAAQ